MTDRGKDLVSLFLTFLKIGAFTFGGGYAMIPLIQKEAAGKRGWITEEELLEVVAVAESTPGPIAVNAATYIGERVAGFPGAFLATLGVILPSFVILLAVSYGLRAADGLRAVRYAFLGLKAGVLALILRALWTMFCKVPKKATSSVLMAAAFLLTSFVRIPAVYVLLGCALAGLVWSLAAERRRKP